MTSHIHIRPARVQDVRAISELMQPLVEDRVLLGKDLVMLYEQVQEFLVATDSEGTIIGYGALHPMWEHLGEVRTLASVDAWRGKGVGSRLLVALEDRARELGIANLFCLTFEVDFFARHGYEPMTEPMHEVLEADVYAELLRSMDDGVAEFLDLARVKQNTLGNTRMLKQLD